MERKVFGSLLEDGRRRDSDAKWYRYLKILYLRSSPISIANLREMIITRNLNVETYWACARTIARLYRRQLCDRILVPTAAKPIKRYEYSISDGGRQWVEHYEMMKEKYGS